jgi:hypothetical protein
MATTTQDTIIVVKTLFDLTNSHQADPAWLDKSLTFLPRIARSSIFPPA